MASGSSRVTPKCGFFPIGYFVSLCAGLVRQGCPEGDHAKIGDLGDLESRVDVVRRPTEPSPSFFPTTTITVPLTRTGPPTCPATPQPAVGAHGQNLRCKRSDDC